MSNRSDEPFDLRPAVAEDASALSALAIESKAMWGYSAEFMQRAAFDLEISSKEIVDNGQFHVIVAHDRVTLRIVGFLSMRKDAYEWDVHRLFVAPDRVRQGIGYALWLDAIHFAEMSDCRSVVIQSDPNAVGFYLRCGAHLEGEVESPVDPKRKLPFLRFQIQRTVKPPSMSGLATTKFLIEPIFEARGRICREILNELPDWFGIPESVEEYASFAEDTNMLGAISDGFVAGFITLRSASDAASEIYVMAIRPSFHRMGLGTALINAASEMAGAAGHHYLTVKTVGPSRPNAAYEATRRFYLAVGFEPIEEFEDLWDENPCLLMLRPI